jgi:YVTN family beta-propeller protein
MRSSKGGVAALGLTCLLSLAVSASAQTAQYQLLKKYSFGPAAGSTSEYFDYILVDSGDRRVYLSRGTEIKVIDADSGALIGNITGLKRDHGVAVAHEFGRGFISDGAQGKVVIFDLKSLKTIGEAKAQDDADCVIYDPASKRVFVMNGDPHSTTVIDAKTGDVVATLPLGGAPEFAVADGGGTVFINLEDKAEVVAIDSHDLKIKSRWSVAPAGGPTALAMDAAHHLLFSAGREPQKLAIIDARSGKVIQSFDITAGADAAAFDADTGRVFVSTREGKIHVFHEDSPEKFSELETITTEYGAKTMAFDEKTHHLFVDTADFAPAPAPTADHPHPQRKAILGTFHVLMYGTSTSSAAR